jgi:hypothetical protein
MYYMNKTVVPTPLGLSASFCVFVESQCVFLRANHSRLEPQKHLKNFKVGNQRLLNQ